MIDDQYVSNLLIRDTDIREHLALLYAIPLVMGAKVIVELGAGQSSYALAGIANKINAQFFSIDLKVGATERGFPEGKGILETVPNYHFIENDDMEVVKDWKIPIDFLFIDTSHEYEHTKQELNSWSSFVRSGGIICLHDTHPNWEGVHKALNEFLEENKKKYLYIHLSNQNGFSILKKL